MARIRTIKPEFWTSHQIIECSPNARLLFVGLLNFCDDAGRHPASPKQCKAEVYPADEISNDDVARMLDELSTNDLIRFYTVENTRYFVVTGWHHQKIDRPQEPKYPDPPSDQDETFDDHSTNDRPLKEGKGEEGKEHTPLPGGERGFELEQQEDCLELPAILDQRPYPDDFESVWSEYKAIANPNATKADAAKAFARLSKADKDACWTGVVRYVVWIREERRKRPDMPVKHLATFINKRGWEPFMEDAA